MSVKFKTVVNRLPDVGKTVSLLNGRKVEVGVLKGEHAWLAGIHEYGCTIRAQNAKYLTVPCSPKAVGKSARDFPDLWTFTSKSGEKFLCRDTGPKTFECLCWLTTEVVIPERAFLRNGHDANIDDVMKRAERAVGQLIAGRMDVQTFLDLIGQTLSGKIETFARNLSDPPNSPITAENKGSNNPLVDTGNMIGSISWSTN